MSEKGKLEKDAASKAQKDKNQGKRKEIHKSMSNLAKTRRGRYLPFLTALERAAQQSSEP